MPTVFSVPKLKVKTIDSKLAEFSLNTSPRLAKITGAEDFEFDVRTLEPGRFSFPYHFHRNAEELFYIISGKAMLRTPEGFSEVGEQDVVFFEKGPTGAHQLYNHSGAPCVYLDLRTTAGVDICEYPDSGKVNILPYMEIYESASKVNYYKGEENVRDKWPDDILRDD